MSHAIASVEESTQGLAPKRPVWRVICECGRLGGWYKTAELAVEFHVYHERAASARDAAQRREAIIAGMQGATE